MLNPLNFKQMVHKNLRNYFIYIPSSFSSLFFPKLFHVFPLGFPFLVQSFESTTILNKYNDTSLSQTVQFTENHESKLGLSEAPLRFPIYFGVGYVINSDVSAIRGKKIVYIETV